jgi:hypothetical protein
VKILKGDQETVRQMGRRERKNQREWRARVRRPDHCSQAIKKYSHCNQI